MSLEQGIKRTMTLLEKARAYQPIRKLGVETPPKQELELVMAWVAGEITIAQVNIALGKKPKGNCTYKLANTIKRAARLGLITIEMQ